MPSSHQLHSALRMPLRMAILRQNQRHKINNAKPTTEETSFMPLLRDHIAVITGAGSGIGRAIALGYAREGAQVVLLDINGKAAEAAAQEIRDSGGAAVSFELNVTKREDCIAAAKRIAEQVGAVT